jgi:nucleotide-binding universal stress UspA family protein
MTAINHILFPYDFSEQGNLASPFVRALACRFGAGITLAGVVPPVWTAPPTGMPPLIGVNPPEMQQDLESRLQNTLADDFAPMPVERVAMSGDPALQIVEFAHTNKVDLIMMPTHGFGLFRNMLVGSVTAKVLHDAKCPVWTATHAEEQRSAAMPRTVLCAVDGTPETLDLMRWAAGFCQTIGAALKMVHVVRPISDWLALPTERDLQEQVRQEARLQLEAQQLEAGVQAPLRLVVGKIAETVCEEARQEGADLILIGRGSLQSTLGRLRTHAYGIIRQSPCPVLSV